MRGGKNAFSYLSLSIFGGLVPGCIEAEFCEEMFILKHFQHLRLLVLGCIETEFCEEMFILKHFQHLPGEKKKCEHFSSPEKKSIWRRGGRSNLSTG